MKIVKLLLPLLILAHFNAPLKGYGDWNLYGDGKKFYENIIDLIDNRNWMSQEKFETQLKSIMRSHDSNVDESQSYIRFLYDKNGERKAFSTFKDIFFFGTDSPAGKKDVIELTETAIKKAQWWGRSTDRLELILEELKKRDALWNEYIQQRASGKYPDPQFWDTFAEKKPPVIPPSVIPPSNFEIAQEIFCTTSETLIGKPMDFVSRITGISYGVDSYCTVDKNSVFGFGVEFCQDHPFIVKRSLAALTTIALSYAAYKLYKKYTKKEEHKKA